MSGYTLQQFVEKWERADLKERASYQEYFMDLCRLVGHPTPAEERPGSQRLRAPASRAARHTGSHCV